MKAARRAPALCGGMPTDLVAGTASHRSNFLAARLNGTENHPKRPAIRRMSAKKSSEMPRECLLRYKKLHKLISHIDFQVSTVLALPRKFVKACFTSPALIPFERVADDPAPN